MKGIARFSLAFILFLVSFSFGESLCAPGARPEAQVDEMLDLAGVKKLTDQIPSVILAQTAPHRQKMGEDFSIISDAINDSYKSADLYRTIRETFNKSFNPGHAAELLKWLRAPLSKKMTKLELLTSTPQGLKELPGYALQLKAHPAKKTRTDLLQKLDKATGSSDLNIEIGVAAFRSTTEEMNALLPREKRLQDEDISDLVKMKRKQLQESVKDFTLVATLYTYRTASDKEIKEYVLFWEGTPGRWFSELAYKGLLEAMTAASQRTNAQIREKLMLQRAPEL
ncbi:MAG: hypothetical protein HYU64_13160 [Armatimonadetes bacterium]|nr:hypothetical protein [Armatimonadota bacterium]